MMPFGWPASPLGIPSSGSQDNAQLGATMLILLLVCAVVAIVVVIVGVALLV